LYLIWTVC